MPWSVCFWLEEQDRLPFARRGELLWQLQRGEVRGKKKTKIYVCVCLSFSVLKGLTGAVRLMLEELRQSSVVDFAAGAGLSLLDGKTKKRKVHVQYFIIIIIIIIIIFFLMFFNFLQLVVIIMMTLLS